MKHLSRLLILAALVIFVSCQNEELTESQSLENENTPEELIEDGDFATDEIDDQVLDLTNPDSEKLVKVKSSFLTGKYDSSSCIPDIEGLVESLPTSVSASTTAKPFDNIAYFALDIEGSSPLAGSNLEAWCADQDLSLDVEGPLNFDVYSSYGDLPEGKFEKPENFDLVNWLLNQDYIGTQSSNGITIEQGHVQYAIWLLVDDSVCQVCTYLTNPTGNWNDDPKNVVAAQELADAALANGEGFVPGCGEKFGIILVPENKQSLIITKVLEPKEEECKDCEGKVTDLTLEFDWKYAKRIKVYQKYENTYYGKKVFDAVVQPNGKIHISGVNQDGSFGRYIYIYVGDYSCYYYAKIKTDCDLKIGPGYEKGVFKVVEGRSSYGGKLCEYVPPTYDCYKYRYWWKCYTNYHWSCYNRYHGKY